VYNPNGLNCVNIKLVEVTPRVVSDKHNFINFTIQIFSSFKFQVNN
jgi:hypothetical protein